MPAIKMSSSCSHKIGTRSKYVKCEWWKEALTEGAAGVSVVFVVQVGPDALGGDDRRAVAVLGKVVVHETRGADVVLWIAQHKKEQQLNCQVHMQRLTDLQVGVNK